MSKEVNYKKIFSRWKKKFKKKHKVYDYGGSLNSEWDLIFSYPYLLKDSDKAKIENNHLSIESEIRDNRNLSEEEIAQIITIAKTDQNASNRYKSVMKLLKIPLNHSLFSDNQIDDIEKMIDYYIKNDDSLVHKLKLILSKEYDTDYYDDYLIPIIEDIISSYKRNSLSETDCKTISLLSIYLWDLCLKKRKLFYVNDDGGFDDSQFTNKIIQLFGTLKVVPAYPIARIFSQLYCPDDSRAAYVNLIRDKYYPENGDVLYETREAAIKALFNFGGDDAITVLERRISDDPDIRLKKIVLSGLLELDRDRAYDFMMKTKYFISKDLYDVDSWQLSELINHINLIFPSRESRKELSILFQGLVENNIYYDLMDEMKDHETEEEAIIREIGWLTEEDIPFLMETLSSNKNELFRYYAALALKILDLNNPEILTELEKILQRETISNVKDALSHILLKKTL